MCAHGHLFATRYARISIKLIFDGKAVLSEAYRVSQSSDEASIRHAVDGAQTLSDSHGFPTQVSALKLGEHARFKDCTGLRGKEFVEGRGAGYCKRFRAQTSSFSFSCQGPVPYWHPEKLCMHRAQLSLKANCMLHITQCSVACSRFAQPISTYPFLLSKGKAQHCGEMGMQELCICHISSD
jgi:hypothetical protein